MNRRQFNCYLQLMDLYTQLEVSRLVECISSNRLRGMFAFHDCLSRGFRRLTIYIGQREASPDCTAWIAHKLTTFLALASPQVFLHHFSSKSPCSPQTAWAAHHPLPHNALSTASQIVPFHFSQVLMNYIKLTPPISPTPKIKLRSDIRTCDLH